MAKIQSGAKQTANETTTPNVASSYKTATKNSNNASGTLFTKQNHKWMAIGGAIIILGFILMIGGKSADPNQFDTNQVYSFIRITLAPVLILIGFGTLVYSILRKG
jgi:hypothetical protein